MVSLEKLGKAFEALRVFQPSGESEEAASKKKDQPVNKKDKMTNCNVVADCICSSNLRSVTDFPKLLGIAMETFLSLCDDSESDVRIVADECLNRTIKTLLETNLGRLQVELYKEIKKNSAQRSLRGSLWRFADMCHLIRPQKCRPYVVNLLPCLARICRRPEEPIQETLAQAMLKMCPVLMPFTNDGEVKMLLKAFLANIKSSSATARRSAASSMILIAQHCRKPAFFYAWLLSTLLDMTVPIDENRDVYILLGVLMTLRHLIPHLCNTPAEGEATRGRIGSKNEEKEYKVERHHLIKVYELLLYYTKHTDHNVVTSSLETLQQLLKNIPPLLMEVLVTPGSIVSTSIHPTEGAPLAVSMTESITCIPSVSDDLGLEDDTYDQVSSGSSDEEEGVNPQVMFEIDPDEGNKQAVINGDVEDNLGAEEEYSSMEIGTVEDEPLDVESAPPTAAPSTSPEEQTIRKGLSEELLVENEEPSIIEDENSQMSTNQSKSTVVQEGDIGSITDKEVPLVHCMRLLCSRFLLNGYKNGLLGDRVVRVSAKALALGCVGSITAIYPRSFLRHLYKKTSSDGGEMQEIRDILMYMNHSDPQLKGNTAILVGNLLKAALCESRGRFHKWVRKYSPSNEDSLAIEDLISPLLSILEDESSVATRLGIIGLKTCLGSILNSVHSEHGLLAMLAVIRIKHNPYWLVKVEVLELLSEVDFKLIHYLEALCSDIRLGKTHYVGNLAIQTQVLEDVVLVLLGDEDFRVRQSASNALVKLISRLFHPIDHPLYDPVIAKTRDCTHNYLHPILHEWSNPPKPMVYGLVSPFYLNPAAQTSTAIESNLSRVIQMLVKQLTKSDNKYTTFGCCHALSLLAKSYKVTQYSSSWCCAAVIYSSSPSSNIAPNSPTARKVMRSLSSSSNGRSVTSHTSIGSISSMFSGLSIDELVSGNAGGPLPLLLSILTSSSVAHDLAAHSHALSLAGNVFAGAAYKCLRAVEDVKPEGSEDLSWAVLSDRLLVPMADILLTHVIRLINVCSHVIEEQVPGPPQTKSSLPSLPTAPSLSPIKRKALGMKEEQAGTQQGTDKSNTKSVGKDANKEAEKEKGKKEGIGYFYNVPHYVKLYEVLRGAYSNYKISLDLSTSEKFGALLRTALQVLSQILEIACISEVGKHAEEFLGYMKSTVVLEPTGTVQCVQQLLKSLFGTNIASQWESSQAPNAPRKPGKATRLASSIRPGLYHCCFTTPYTQFTQCLATAQFRNATSHIDQDDGSSWLSWLKKRSEKKIPAILKPGSKTDKNSIASYIRLFEPLVIKALKQYTITSCIKLQKQVLNLLAQLVQLRVNYCLLDSDKIFIGFVIKQFEFIEEGHVRNGEILIPHIFDFLVLLSYEKYHSKTIIDMPKIIQLCDGIMASGLDPEMYAIPALEPIVYDLFVQRSAIKSDASKDLETQREFLVSMLLRLIKYYQVIELMMLVLHQCHKEGEDKWKRLSRQVVDMVLPLLTRQGINLDSQVALDVIHRMFESVAPSVFRPVDSLLVALFDYPMDLSSCPSVQRWMCLVLSILRVLIAQSKEEVVLSRLHELQLHITILKDTGQPPGEEVSEGPPTGGFGLPAEVLFARYLLQVVGRVAYEIRNQSVNLKSNQDEYSFLCQQMSHLLLFMTHMFQSGIFRRVATVTMGLLREQCPSEFYSVQEINKLFRDISTAHPTLTLQWCNVLILLNYDEQEWWSCVLQTKNKYCMSSPSHGSCDVVESLLAKTRCCNLEIVRRGALVLFCDYVMFSVWKRNQCENLNDAEQMTWVIINHVNDLIQLSREPPVTDFISAIHRNSAASGLFIQAIHSRCEHFSKPSLVKQTLHCLEAIHLSQSGALLTLLIDKFLNTHHLSVARICDAIACRRIEMLLVESAEESGGQLPLEDLEKLVQFIKSNHLANRHARLLSLLYKLQADMSATPSPQDDTQQSHPLALSSIKDININKDWFLTIVKEECFGSCVNTRKCAKLLQHLDYSSILSIIMDKEFPLSCLEECISLGTQRSLWAYQQYQDATPSPPSSPSRQQPFDPLFKAAEITLFRHINDVINTLPVPHQVISYSQSLSSKEEEYREKIEDLFVEDTWSEDIFSLAVSLLQYLVCLDRLPWKAEVPQESLKDAGRFSTLVLETVHWMLVHNQLPSSLQLQTSVELYSHVLQSPKLGGIIIEKEQTTWVCSAIRTVHQLLTSLLVVPGERLVTLPHQEGQEETPDVILDDVHLAIKACDETSELVHCLKTHLDPINLHSKVPQFLAATLRNLIIGLARLPLVNSYARTPPLVWKLGWMPSPSGDTRTRLPPLPQHFLQEKDVLKEFIYRVNMLGWTSRQQFEETWMCLLGVLSWSNSQEEEHIGPEEDIDRTQCVVLAIRCITSLLVQSTLTPVCGDPSNSYYEHKSRDQPMPFLQTRTGKKLSWLRALVEREIQVLYRHRSDRNSHHQKYEKGLDADVYKYLFTSNTEHTGFDDFFSLGQMSIESIWNMLGMLDTKPLEDDAETSTDTSPESPKRLLRPIAPGTRSTPRSATIGGLDIHSCIEFLLELYKQLLSPTMNPKPPLMQLNETIKSVIALSDVFTEKQQYERMLETLLEVHKNHPSEDELSLQYLVVGICKAAAVVGSDTPTTERIVKLIEPCLRSTHLPTKIATLYGSLYIFETGPTDITLGILPLLTEYITKSLGSITLATIHSEHHVLLLWSCAFYIIQNYQEELKDSDFTAKMLQLCIATVSNPEEMTPLCVYLAIMKGLEKLILSDVLSQQDADALVKLSVDRLCLPSPQRALAALGLMLTCMYFGKQADQWSPTAKERRVFFGEDDSSPEDPESLIIAMERVTVLFDRIRKGFPYEARVITRVLPTFLIDFFPPQDIMNKVIGEFLSSQQPHPQLMAKVVFQVFDNLLQTNQHGLVKDWVMLSLSNFTQRSPVAMATWSLSCFFISASNNKWLRALFPHVVSRMGKMEAEDRKIFCLAASAFKHSLKDDAHSRSFLATFHAVANQPGAPYAQLLSCCT